MKRVALITLFIIFLFMHSGCSDDIHSAAKRGDEEAVKSFISKGANVNAVNKDGTPVLCMAIKGGNIDVVKILLDAGADLSLQDPLLGTPLHVAAANGRTDIIELLLDRGANINALSDRLNESPIWQAVRGRHAKAVKMLLNHGANPNNTWDDGSSLLHMAAGMGEEEIVNILIDAGIDINICDKDGMTPLYSAISGFIMKRIGFNHKDIITFLEAIS